MSLSPQAARTRISSHLLTISGCIHSSKSALPWPNASFYRDLKILQWVVLLPQQAKRPAKKNAVETAEAIWAVPQTSACTGWLRASNPDWTSSGWWFEPLWKIWKSIGTIIPNMWKNKVMFQSPPTSHWASTPSRVNWALLCRNISRPALGSSALSTLKCQGSKDPGWLVVTASYSEVTQQRHHFMVHQVDPCGGGQVLQAWVDGTQTGWKGGRIAVSPLLGSVYIYICIYIYIYDIYIHV